MNVSLENAVPDYQQLKKQMHNSLLIKAVINLS